MQMRTTLDIDDRVMRTAQEFAPEGMTKTAIIEEGLRLFAQKQAQRAIAEGAAFTPNFQPPPRRRA